MDLKRRSFDPSKKETDCTASRSSAETTNELTPIIHVSLIMEAVTSSALQSPQMKLLQDLLLGVDVLMEKDWLMTIRIVSLTLKKSPLFKPVLTLGTSPARIKGVSPRLGFVMEMMTVLTTLMKNKTVLKLRAHPENFNAHLEDVSLQHSSVTLTMTVEISLMRLDA